MISVVFTVGCKELAEHVVDQAKGRLARRPKKVVHKLPTTPKHGSIPRNSNSNPPSSMITHRDMTTISSRTGDNSCVSPLKCKLVTVCSLANSSNFPKISQSSTSLIQSKTSLIQLKTIYLSEKHSSTPKDTGIPNVPPSTPDSIFSCSHNYILSLNDIKVGNKYNILVTSTRYKYFTLYRVKGTLKANYKHSVSYACTCTSVNGSW